MEVIGVRIAASVPYFLYSSLVFSFLLQINTGAFLAPNQMASCGVFYYRSWILTVFIF